MKRTSWPLMHNNVSRQDLDIIIDYLQQEDPRLTNGPKVEEFETEWSHWLGVRHSVMVNSGSSANDLSLLALKEIEGPGEVIVPALTWVSDIASVLHAGYKPVFCDITLDSLGLNLDSVLNSITKSTKAIFLTHVLGFNALSDEFLDAIDSMNVKIIEDVCESHGATHSGNKLGTFGFISNFSFYYAHHMTTIEGGMVCTNDDVVFDLVRMMRSHGMLRESPFATTRAKAKEEFKDLNPEFIFMHSAHNMRPTEINGILGLSQLQRLDFNNRRRQENFRHFIRLLDPAKFFTEFRSDGSCNYAFTIVLREASFTNRDKVESTLCSNGIEYRRGLSGGGNQLRQPYLKNFGINQSPESLPVTDFVHHFAWYVGNNPQIELNQIEFLTNKLNSAF